MSLYPPSSANLCSREKIEGGILHGRGWDFRPPSILPCSVIAVSLSRLETRPGRLINRRWEITKTQCHFGEVLIISHPVFTSSTATKHTALAETQLNRKFGSLSFTVNSWFMEITHNSRDRREKLHTPGFERGKEEGAEKWKVSLSPWEWLIVGGNFPFRG